jgi:cell division transport system permease protein
MTLAAVSTVAVALFLVGGLGYAYFKTRDYAASLESRFTMRAFLRDGTKYDQIHDAAEAIRAIPGVAQVQWIPRDKAWEKWQRDYPGVGVGLDNPFPDALKVRLSSLRDAEAAISRIDALPQIDPQARVQYLAAEQRFLSEGLGLLRLLGIALGGLCFATAGVLIFNAIRLTVLSRRKEIRIMQLVGAPHATIRIPFLIEGALQGAMGGVLATFLLWMAHVGIERLMVEFSAIGNPGAFPASSALAWLTLAGIGYGLACSAMAVRSPIRLGTSAP